MSSISDNVVIVNEIHERVVRKLHAAIDHLKKVVASNHRNTSESSL
jgi:hypothetical protein